jgi:hypothetical protein|tara:strand:- start:84 stop:548 length:465 start_codon:yes stop_codon:yes gene_type:complete
MKTLKIDDKWSVEYDPENNGRFGRVFCNSEVFPISFDTSGSTIFLGSTLLALLKEKLLNDSLMERLREANAPKSANQEGVSAFDPKATADAMRNLLDRACSIGRRLEAYGYTVFVSHREISEKDIETFYRDLSPEYKFETLKVAVFRPRAPEIL